MLLERIREVGSIAAAARDMEMAYSHAWTLVANMNRLAEEDLVGRTFGGLNGVSLAYPCWGGSHSPILGTYWQISSFGLMIKKFKLAGILTIAILYIEWP